MPHTSAYNQVLGSIAPWINQEIHASNSNHIKYGGLCTAIMATDYVASVGVHRDLATGGVIANVEFADGDVVAFTIREPLTEPLTDPAKLMVNTLDRTIRKDFAATYGHSSNWAKVIVDDFAKVIVEGDTLITDLQSSVTMLSDELTRLAMDEAFTFASRITR